LEEIPINGNWHWKPQSKQKVNEKLANFIILYFSTVSSCKFDTTKVLFDRHTHTYPHTVYHNSSHFCQNVPPNRKYKLVKINTAIVINFATENDKQIKTNYRYKVNNNKTAIVRKVPKTSHE